MQRSGTEQNGTEWRTAFAELFHTGRFIIQQSEHRERCSRVFTPSGNKTYSLWGGQRHAASCRQPPHCLCKAAEPDAPQQAKRAEKAVRAARSGIRSGSRNGAACSEAEQRRNAASSSRAGGRMMQDAFALQRSMSAWRRSRNALLRSCLAAAGGLKGCEPLEAWALTPVPHLAARKRVCTRTGFLCALHACPFPDAEAPCSGAKLELQGDGSTGGRPCFEAKRSHSCGGSLAGKQQCSCCKSAGGGKPKARSEAEQQASARRQLCIRLVTRLALPHWKAA